MSLVQRSRRHHGSRGKLKQISLKDWKDDPRELGVKDFEKFNETLNNMLASGEISFKDFNLKLTGEISLTQETVVAGQILAPSSFQNSISTPGPITEFKYFSSYPTIF